MIEHRNAAHLVYRVVFIFFKTLAGYLSRSGVVSSLFQHGDTSMSNVIVLNQAESEDRFAAIRASDINAEEQDSIINLALEVLRNRYRPGQELTSPDVTKNYLRIELSELKNECFGALFLDNKNRVICNEILFKGSISSASVYPRVVAQRSLEINAASLILYHNHPSGVPEPSQSDSTITKRLIEALALVDIRVLDHLVVGSEGVVSLAEHGMI